MFTPNVSSMYQMFMLGFQGHKSVFDIGGWFGGASVPIAYLRAQEGFWRECAPSEAGKFCIFKTGIVQFGDKILFESLKISHF